MQVQRVQDGRVVQGEIRWVSLLRWWNGRGEDEERIGGIYVKMCLLVMVWFSFLFVLSSSRGKCLATAADASGST